MLTPLSTRKCKTFPTSLLAYGTPIRGFLARLLASIPAYQLSPSMATCIRSACLATCKKFSAWRFSSASSDSWFYFFYFWYLLVLEAALQIAEETEKMHHLLTQKLGLAEFFFSACPPVGCLCHWQKKMSQGYNWRLLTDFLYSDRIWQAFQLPMLHKAGLGYIYTHIVMLWILQISSLGNLGNLMVQFSFWMKRSVCCRGVIHSSPKKQEASGIDECADCTLRLNVISQNRRWENKRICYNF